MRKIALVFVTFALAVVPQACRRGQAGSSHTENIATDLPDDGGGRATSLFWTNNGNIYRGRCTDPTQFNQHMCSQDQVSMPYDTFKSDLDDGLSATIRELTAEAKRVEAAIALIQADLNDANAELDRLEHEQGGLDAELTTLRTHIKDFETNLGEYKQQLALIDQALSQAADQDIAAMRPIVLARIADWQARITQVSARIEAILEEFSGLRTQIEQVTTRVAALTVRSQNLQVELADVNQRLELAYGDFSVYEETLRRLNSGITYAVWSTNTILMRQRLFIRRFEAIFAHHT